MGPFTQGGRGSQLPCGDVQRSGEIPESNSRNNDFQMRDSSVDLRCDCCGGFWCCSLFSQGMHACGICYDVINTGGNIVRRCHEDAVVHRFPIFCPDTLPDECISFFSGTPMGEPVPVGMH